MSGLLIKPCVLCQKNEADSAEHIPFKAHFFSELIEKSIVLTSYDGIKNGSSADPIESKNFPKLKPVKNLCADCNNNKTQRLDRAYEQEIKRIYGEVKKYVARELQQGRRPKEKTFSLDLFKRKNVQAYWAKVILCLLEQKNFTSSELQSFALSPRNDTSPVDVQISLTFDLVEMLGELSKRSGEDFLKPEHVDVISMDTDMQISDDRRTIYYCQYLFGKIKIDVACSLKCPLYQLQKKTACFLLQKQ